MFLDYKNIIYFLFPPSTKEILLNSVSVDYFINLYLPTVYMNTTVLLPYSNKYVKASIYLMKFNYNKRAYQFLSSVLHKYVDTLPAETIIIPIPLGRKRKQDRGYNQVTEVVKKAIQTNPDVHIYERVLCRTTETKKQTSLSKEERKQNIIGVFSVKKYNAQNIEGKNIILLDDVLTTGATMQEAKATLLPLNPAKITCVALSH